jgi:hypothetical protein
LRHRHIKCCDAGYRSDAQANVELIVRSGVRRKRREVDRVAGNAAP